MHVRSCDDTNLSADMEYTPKEGLRPCHEHLFDLGSLLQIHS